jgi:hypothetical protein
MPKGKSRRRSASGRFVKGNPRRKRRAVAMNPAPRKNPRRRRPTARRSYRNPAELMELANPAFTAREKALALSYLQKGISSTKIAYMLGYAPSTIRKFAIAHGLGPKYKKHKSRGKKRGRPKGKKKGKKVGRPKGKRGKKYTRKMRTMYLKIPRKASRGRLQIAFNPMNRVMANMKEGAIIGAWAGLGFVGSSFLTNLINGKLTSSGTNLKLGPLLGSSIVAVGVAMLVPFLPIQHDRMKLVIAGSWMNALSHLVRDIVPTGSGIQKYLPTTMGDFAALPMLNYGQPSYALGGYSNPANTSEETFDVGDEVVGEAEPGMEYYQDGVGDIDIYRDQDLY